MMNSQHSHTICPYTGKDDLGRILPDCKTVGLPKKDRFVGIFYLLWHGTHNIWKYNEDLCNIDEILKNNLADPHQPEHEAWPKPGTFSYWDKPLFGYYRSDDGWVVRKHMQMLGDAGIDYLLLDASNNRLFVPEAVLLMRTIEELQKQGAKVPQVAFLTHTNSSPNMDEIYHTFYAENAPHRYPNTWFYWKGKPLIIGEDPSDIVKDFFTFRYSQWPNEPKQANNGWDWISFEYPQRVNYNDAGEKEQIAVSIAQNCGSSAVFSYTAWYNMDDPASRSRNYHDGAEDETPGAINKGLNFQEQWDNAIKEDPQTILVLEWNDWIAGNWASKPTDPLMLYDCVSDRWSRDIEPMTGGFGDNYYMQLMYNIRRYKGIEAPELPAESKTIHVNSDYSQWMNVGPVYKDYTGDTIERNHTGVDSRLYLNNTGRNDFDKMKVCSDEDNLYFYVCTVNPITHYTDSNWMTLLISTQADGEKNWYGYDYVVNRKTPASNSSCTLERSRGGWDWEIISEDIRYNISGNEMMLMIPRDALGGLSDPINIQFKWVDNWQNEDRIMDFYEYGDAAPDGRLNYVYTTSGMNR